MYSYFIRQVDMKEKNEEKVCLIFEGHPDI